MGLWDELVRVCRAYAYGQDTSRLVDRPEHPRKRWRAEVGPDEDDKEAAKLLLARLVAEVAFFLLLR